MTRIYQRCHPVHDPALRRLYVFEHYQCLLCGKPGARAAREDIMGLCAHHIVKPGRSDEAANLVSICHPCHCRVEEDGHGPRITMGMVLWSKKNRDPDNWRPRRLRELYGRRLPRLVSIERRKS